MVGTTRRHIADVAGSIRNMETSEDTRRYVAWHASQSFIRDGADISHEAFMEMCNLPATSALEEGF